MPTPASSATAAIGARASARNTSRAAARIASLLRAACWARPAVALLMSSRLAVERIVPLWYAWITATKRSVPEAVKEHKMSEIRPFRTHVPQADVDDLRKRLD